jgi:hypothetical protein
MTTHCTIPYSLIAIPYSSLPAFSIRYASLHTRNDNAPAYSLIPIRYSLIAIAYSLLPIRYSSLPAFSIRSATLHTRNDNARPYSLIPIRYSLIAIAYSLSYAFPQMLRFLSMTRYALCTYSIISKFSNFQIGFPSHFLDMLEMTTHCPIRYSLFPIPYSFGLFLSFLPNTEI